MPQQHSSLARTSLFLGGCTALSRLMGLLRDMAMAWLVGGGLAADALVAAMRACTPLPKGGAPPQGRDKLGRYS